MGCVIPRYAPAGITEIPHLCRRQRPIERADRRSRRASAAAKPCESQKPPRSSESVAEGVGRGFGAVARTDLGVGVVEVALDGVDAEYELLGDLPVGQPRGNESQHFRLTTRQTVRQTPARTPELVDPLRPDAHPELLDPGLGGEQQLPAAGLPAPAASERLVEVDGGEPRPIPRRL